MSDADPGGAAAAAARTLVALRQFAALCEALALRVQALEAEVPRLRALRSRVAAGDPAVLAWSAERRVEFRRLWDAGTMPSECLASLNAMLGAVLTVPAVTNAARRFGFPPRRAGRPRKRDTSAGQAVCGNEPAPEGGAAGVTGSSESGPPTIGETVAAVVTAAPMDTGLPLATARLNGDRALLAQAEATLPKLPHPPRGEASWNDCVAYCREYGLPEFRGDMLVLNLHLEKRGKKPWVLVTPFGPGRAAAPEARA